MPFASTASALKLKNLLKMKDNEFNDLLREAVRRRSEAPLPSDFNAKIIGRLSRRPQRKVRWLAAAAAAVAAAAILIAFIPLAFNVRSRSETALDYLGEVELEYQTRIDHASEFATDLRQDFNDISKHYEP